MKLRALCLVIALLLHGFAQAKDWLPAAGFDSPQDQELLAMRAELCAKSVTTPLFCDETLLYRIRAFGMPGIVTQTLDRITFSGRCVYRAHQAGAVAGQQQDEECLIETNTLLPVNYCRVRGRSSHQARTDRKDWDWLGLRLFSEGSLLLNGLQNRTLYRRVERLEIEDKNAAIDPLSAMMRFRHAAINSTNALLEKEYTVIEGNDAIYNAMFKTSGTAAQTNHPLLGTCKIASVETTLCAKNQIAGRMRIDLAMDKQAIPVKYDGVWRGIPFEMTLIHVTIHPSP